MKEIIFLGDSLERIRAFPEDVKHETGYQLHRVQNGDMPTHFKPMLTIGSGIVEIRIKDADGIYRIIYTARIANNIYVLHAFQKKSQKTAKPDIELAKSRYKQLIQEHHS